MSENENNVAATEAVSPETEPQATAIADTDQTVTQEENVPVGDTTDVVELPAEPAQADAQPTATDEQMEAQEDSAQQSEETKVGAHSNGARSISINEAVPVVPLIDSNPTMGGAEIADVPSSEGMAPVTTIIPDKKPKRKIPWIPIVVAVVLVGAAYLGGSVAFANMFFPNTILNGKDVSLKSVTDVAEENSASVNEFSFTLTGDNVEATIHAQDINASYDGDGFAKEAIKQQDPWSWPLELFNQHSLTVESGMAYDLPRMEELVSQAVDKANEGAQESKNAEAYFDEESARYKIKPEEQGTVVDKALVLDAVHKAIETDQPTLTLDESYLVKPTIMQDDENLNQAVERVNASIEASQDIVTHDQTVYVVDENELKKWVHLAEDYSVSFDLDACINWAKGALSEQLDSRGSTRTYTRPDGKEITVSDGTYGWVIDGEAIANKIAENVRAGTKGTIDVIFSQEAAEWNPGGKDWGDKYIDVDLTEQHVRYYDGNKIIWETDCVSGGLDDRGVMHATPTGVYYINSNMRSGHIKLTGEIDPATKKPIYISYVDYWMPFLDDAVALHDADWRSSFGGEIYKTAGSHGCVNLPVGKAKELYGMVGTGTVVVVHD